MRRATKIRLVTLAILCGGCAYLARFAILAPIVRCSLRNLVPPDAGMRVEFDRLGGNLVDTLEVSGLAIEGTPGKAALRKLTLPYARVEYSLPALILGRSWLRSVIMTGDECVIDVDARTRDESPESARGTRVPRELARAEVRFASIAVIGGDQRFEARNVELRCTPRDGQWELAWHAESVRQHHISVPTAATPTVAIPTLPIPTLPIMGEAAVDARWDGNLLIAGVTLAGQSLGTVEARLGMLSQRQLSLDANLLLFGGVEHIVAAIDARPGSGISRVHVESAGIALEQTPGFVLRVLNLPEPPRGTLDLSFEAELNSGDPSRARASLNLALRHASLAGSPECQASGSLQLGERELRVPKLEVTSGVSAIRVSQLVVPLDAGRDGVWPRVRGNLHVDLADLVPWMRVYLPRVPDALARQARVVLDACAADGGVECQQARVSFDDAAISLSRASVRWGAAGLLDASLDVRVTSNDGLLAALAAELKLPISGRLRVTGELQGTLHDWHGHLEARIPDLVLSEGIGSPVQQLQADVLGTVDLTGSMRAPEWRADLVVHRGSVKVSPAVPVLTAINAELAASSAGAMMSSVAADLGVGPLRIQGQLPAPWTREPSTFDLSITGQDVLLTRANGLRVRADLDLHVQGPTDHARVSGTIALRDGRFARHVPLRPFGERSPVKEETFKPFSFNTGMFAGWTFDVSVRTADAFTVDSNLAHGNVTIDLALQGTGAAPYFTGAVDFSQMRLILPFTSFDVESGSLRFGDSDPYDPDVLLVAHSRRRSIDVDLDVHGTWRDPQVTFASSPPLPSDDVLVLVTTGRLPDEFAGRAGRQGLALAGSFFGRELFAEMFSSSSTESQQDFLDRLSVEIGTEINSSGRENILIEYDLADPWFLQAERDVYNDYNIGLVYRIRFR